MTKKNSLKVYKEKRNLKISTEPKAIVKKSHIEPIFVVQQHDAQAMHYDFRIESNGVLKSWAIPKGPSMDPKVKRLAVPTEDHPIDYAEFEGVIPKGHYGAGPVIVWDTGTYRNLELFSIDQCFDRGEITIWLKGKKLKGGFALVRTKLHNKNNWILVKMRDQEAKDNINITEKRTKSVLTKRDITQVEDEE